MSFIQFFRILWGRRAIILVSTLFCFLAALIAGTLIPARYVAHSRVLLDLVKPDPVTGQMISSTFARAYVKTQTELITDYRVAGRVVDALGWTSSPQFQAQYAARSATDNRDFRRWLAQIVIDRTDGSLLEGTNILDITYTSPQPELAARVADAVRQAYIDQAVSFRREDAERNSQWFRQQADNIKAQLTIAEKKKSDFERENGIVLTDDNTDTETERLKSIAAASAAAPTVTQSAPVAAAAANPALAQADAQIAAAEKVLGPNHPDLQNLRRQRAALAAAGSAGGRAIASRPIVSGPSIASQYSAQQAKVLAQRGKVNEAQQLARDVAVLRDQYVKTATRAADLAQQGESTETGLTLLGSAVAPATPAFPNWFLIIPGSIGFGMALGILSSLVVELLSRRVRGPEDLRLPDVPVIGMMAPAPLAGRRRTWMEWLGFRSRRPSEMAISA